MPPLAPPGHGRFDTARGTLRPRPKEPVLRASRTRRPLVSAVLALLVVLTGTGSADRRVPAAVADGTPPPLGDLTFYGRGYGHGVGMSQYGARGRALAGQKAPAILAHYYPGTTFGTRSPGTIVRILLATGFVATAAKPLTVLGSGSTWRIDGIATLFPAGARLTLVPTAAGATTWALRVRAADGKTLASKTVSGDIYVRPGSGATSLQLLSTSTTNLYRGLFRIHLTTTAIVINHLQLDRYLRSVVPLEMPSTWPAEALKVQAIAARSYAVSHLHPGVGSFDLYDDTRSQVYRGRRSEVASTTAAVDGTAGQVLLSGSSVVNAVFHSADGGATENNENVWVSATGEQIVQPMSYLRGSSDRAADGSSYDKTSPNATWKTATYTADALSVILARDPRTAVGTLTAIDLSNRGVSGRLISVTLTGTLGTRTVSGEVFRTVFNTKKPPAHAAIRSTLFDLAPIP
jgi:stage II sporulation protein D